MRNQESNPPLPPLLRGVTRVVAAALLAAGGGLFFLPEVARLAWLWVALFALLFGLGLALIWWSSSQREAGQ